MNEATGGNGGNLARRWKLVVLIVVAVVVAAALVLWFGPGPNVPQEPLRWTRNQAGRMVPVGDTEPGRRAHFSARAEVTEARTSLNTTTASFSSDNSRFACGRVLVVNESDHPLIAQAALKMIEHLKGVPYVHHIEYLPPGKTPKKGERAPDICIRLNLDRLDELNLLVKRDLNARVLASASSSWTKSRHGYRDSRTPPLVTYHWQGRLSHESQAHGVASAAARYIQPAKEIGEELGKGLASQFDKFYEKYGPLPDLPDEFYPQWSESRPLPFLEEYETRLLCSWHRLMVANETFWEMKVPGHAGDATLQIADAMEAAGWNVEDRGSEQSPHMRAYVENAVVEVFPKDVDRSWPGPVVATEPPEKEGEPGRSILYVCYQERMGREELAHAVDKTLTKDSPLPELLMFRTMWTKEQRQGAMRLLEKRHLREPEAWITLAELYGDDEKEKARDAVLRAHVLTRTMKEPGDLKSRIRRRAKKLGMGKLSDQPVPESLLQEYGFVKLTPDAEKVETEVGVDEHASFFLHTEEGLVTTTVRVVRKPKTNGGMSYVLQLVSQRGGSRSWSEGGEVREDSPVVRGSSFGGSHRCEVTAQKLSGKKRFRIGVKVR